MKKQHILIIVYLVLFQLVAFAFEPFRFALFTDLHISTTNLIAAEDLQNAVKDVNAMQGIDFVLVSGDIADKGDTTSLKQAKTILKTLNMPFYIIAGNHDIKWNENGSIGFKHVFGDTRFTFTHKGFQFIGITTAPLTKNDNGVIQNQDIDWIKDVLAKSGTKFPFFVVTHYPLQTGDVNNWKDLTDILKKYNVQAVLGGHYHRNVLFNYDGILGIISRSTLRAKDVVGGYSLFTVSDSIKVSEKQIGQPEEQWLAMPLLVNQTLKTDY